MAHIDYHQLTMRPTARHLMDEAAQHTQRMLVLSGVGAMMIVVAAALFMTMF